LKNRSEGCYMVDYGLAKLHLDKSKKPLPPRLNTDFRGTLTYSSLNAHYKQELSRRDDLFSFFFVILDLLDEVLPWRLSRDDKDEIKKKKEICLNNPDQFLPICKNKVEIKAILNHLKTLRYEDKPNYDLIRVCLKELRAKELKKKLIVENNSKKNTPLNEDNLAIHSPNLILLDFPAKNNINNPTNEYINNMMELNKLMKNDKTLNNNPNHLEQPKFSLTNIGSNLSFFNNSLQNNLVYLNNNKSNHIDNNFSSEMEKLLNFCCSNPIKQIIPPSQQNLSNNIFGLNNSTFSSTSSNVINNNNNNIINNLISKFAPKKEEQIGSKESHNLNKKRKRKDDSTPKSEKINEHNHTKNSHISK